MVLDSKQFRKVLLFWLGSFLVIGIILYFFFGVPVRPIFLGGLVALALLVVKQLIFPEKKPF